MVLRIGQVAQLHVRFAAMALLAVLTGCDRTEPARGAEHSSSTPATAAKPPSLRPLSSVLNTTSSETRAEGKAISRSASASPALSNEAAPGFLSSRLIFSGRVRLHDGTPARDALVRLVRPDSAPTDTADRVLTETRTASNGNYFVEVDPEPHLFVKASLPGAATAEAEVRDPSSAPARSAVRRISTDFTLSTGTTLAGQLVDQAGAPVPEARVFFTRPYSKGSRQANTGRTVSGPDGRFAFPDVAEGKVTLAVRSEKAVPLTRQVTAPDPALTVTLNTEGAVIAGNVFRLEGRDAVASATVDLWAGPRLPAAEGARPLRQAVTDHLGAFSFDHLSSGTYTLSARSRDMRLLPGRTHLTPVFSLAENETSDGVSLYLYSGHLVEGGVTDRLSSKPLEGVKIRAGTAPDLRTAETGPDGRYRLAALFGDHSGRVRLSVAREGYMLAGSNPDDQSVEITLDADPLQVERDLQLVPLVRLSGTVRSSAGQPIAGAAVRPLEIGAGLAGAANAVTDPDGHYELLVAPRRMVRVKALAKGYGEGISASTQVEDEPVSGVEIILQAGAVVSGSVVDEKGQPISGAAVVANFAPHGSTDNTTATRQVQTTAANGTFTFADVPAREISLVANKHPFVRSPEQRVSLLPGEAKGGIRLVLRSGQQLAGRVTDEGGKPVSGASVRADSKLAGDNSYGFATTGEDGRFTIRNLSSVAVDVAASKPGYLSARKPGVKPGEGDVDLVLKRAAEVKFTGLVVEAGSRKPVDDFKVQVLPGGEAVKDAAAPGRFTVKGLRQGDRYRVVVEAASFQPNDTGWRMVPSDQEEITETFEVGGGGAVIGRAVSQGSKSPVAGLAVDVSRYTNDLLKRHETVKPTVTGADGTFRLEGVPVGVAVVVLRRQDPKLEVSRTISVGHGQDADLGDIEIGEGPGLRGLVLKQTGDTPIAGATVVLDDKYSNREERTVTDSAGTFRFEGVRTGEYFVRLPEHRQSLYVTLVEDKVKEITIRVGEAGLRGTVLRAGQPIRAEVTLSQPGVDVDKSVRAGDDGVFEVTGLTPGYWRVAIIPAVSGNQVRVPHVFSTEVPADGMAQEVYELPSGRLSGIVLGPDRTPVGGATVALFLPGGTRPDGSRQSEQRANKTTGADGTFVFEAFPDGIISVDARKAGVGSARLEGVVMPAEGDAQPLTLNLSGGGTLRSTVLNMTTGNPIPQAWCYLDGEGGRLNHAGKREANGEMIIRDIPPGQYLVQVSAYNYSVAEHVADIKAGETVSFDDVLYEAGAVNVTVVDASVKRLGGIPCRITPNDANSIESPRDGLTDSKGDVNWRGLFPGNYTVTIAPPGLPPIVRPVMVQAHQPLFLVIEAK